MAVPEGADGTGEDAGFASAAGRTGGGPPPRSPREGPVRPVSGDRALAPLHGFAMPPFAKDPAAFEGDGLGCGDGYPAYTWSQTEDQVQISFSIPAGVKPKTDMIIRFTETTIHVALKGRLSKLKGILFAPINPFESLWQIEPHKTPSKRLFTVHLEKASVHVQWPLLVRAGLDGERGVARRDAAVERIETSASAATPRPPIDDDGDDCGGDPDLDPTSEFELAKLHESTSPDIAMRHVLRSAAGGHVPAMLRAAAFYELGGDDEDGRKMRVPVERDARKAFLWHKRAADTGDPEACYVVATALLAPAPATEGAGEHAATPPASPSEVAGAEKAPPEIVNAAALAYFRRAVSAGGPDARYYTSAAFQAGLVALRGGNGLPNEGDPREARDFWILSAAGGHPLSCWNLGVLAVTGAVGAGGEGGVEPPPAAGAGDIETAKEWFRKALELDHTLKIPPGFEAIVGDVWEAAKRKRDVAAAGEINKRRLKKKKKKKKEAAAGKRTAREGRKQPGASVSPSVWLGVSALAVAICVGLWVWKRKST